MPFDQQLLLKIPTIPLTIIIVVTSVILAIAMVLLIHHFDLYRGAKKNSGVATILFGAEALVYSILLSLVLFSTWSGFKSADSTVQREANCLVELYRSTEAFLPEIKENTRLLLEEYAKSVINEEWKTLARSELNPRTTEISKQLWQLYTIYSPKTEREQVFLEESIRKLHELRECRTTRLSDSKMGVYPALWFVLIAGEIVIVTSIAFFAEDLTNKLTIVIIFAALVGLIFSAIILFDFPYTGAPTVSREPFKQVISYW